LFRVAGDPISLDQSIPKDRALNQTIVEYAQIFVKLTTDVVTQATADFLPGCIGRIECPMGNLITDCMMSEQKVLSEPVDFAFTNGGGIRVSLSKGNVTAESILNVLPFGNAIVNFAMTGAQIMEMLDRWAGNGDAAKPLISKPLVSGLVWKYDESLPAGKRVLSAKIGGTDILASKTYKVSTIDFVLNGGDNLVTTFKPAVMPAPGSILADLVTSCLRKSASITPSLDNRTTSSTATHS
jgi:5'-nucleotidase/UDP-sugar diphosphatase